MKRIIAIILLSFALIIPTACAEATSQLETATFAGGCFWCMEGPFDKLDGVISTTSGYIGGSKKNPTYRQVSGGGTGHAEAVQIKYDPSKVSYEKLLEIYWLNIDPTVKNRQFCDSGSQYRSAIFYHDDSQKQLATASKDKVKQQLMTDIYTQVVLADQFYPAEDYHQDYYLKNPLKYKYYRFACGRDKRLEEIWGESVNTAN